VTASWSLALAAGLVAAVNPCGFALLPAYLSVLVSVDGTRSGTAGAVGRALTATAAMTLGFVAVFGAFGLLAAPLADAVARAAPWIGIAFGLVLAALGLWLLAGRSLPTFRRGPSPGRAGSLLGFGMAYAIASLGCTVGPFLVIVVAQFRAGSVPAAIGLFLAYAAGMGLVVGTTAVAVALANASLVRRLRRLEPLVARAGGLLMVAAGGYVAYYGWYETRVLRGARPGDPVVDALGRVQGWLAGGIDRFGPVPWLVVLGAAVLTPALTAAWGRRRGARSRPGTAPSPPRQDPDRATAPGIARG
jgi:cytochrome c-type biogenesis protein